MSVKSGSITQDELRDVIRNTMSARNASMNKHDTDYRQNAAKLLKSEDEKIAEDRAKRMEELQNAQAKEKRRLTFQQSHDVLLSFHKKDSPDKSEARQKRMNEFQSPDASQRRRETFTQGKEVVASLFANKITPSRTDERKSTHVGPSTPSKFGSLRGSQSTVEDAKMAVNAALLSLNRSREVQSATERQSDEHSDPGQSTMPLEDSVVGRFVNDLAMRGSRVPAPEEFHSNTRRNKMFQPPVRQNTKAQSDEPQHPKGINATESTHSIYDSPKLPPSGPSLLYPSFQPPPPTHSDFYHRLKRATDAVKIEFPSDSYAHEFPLIDSIHDANTVARAWLAVEQVQKRGTGTTEWLQVRNDLETIKSNLKDKSLEGVMNAILLRTRNPSKKESRI